MKWFKEKSKIKKRVLYFEKRKKWYNETSYKEIADSSLIEKILELVETLNCDLIDVQLKPYCWSDECKIVIKSEKDEFLKFTREFTTYFKEHIQDINFTLE